MWDIQTIQAINQTAAEAVEAGKCQRTALEKVVEDGMSPTKMVWFTSDGKPPKEHAGMM